MKRSTFIYYSLIGTAVVAMPSLACNNNDSSKVLRQPAFLSHICDAKTLREIGQRYKDQFPAQTTQEKLYDQLLTDNNGKVISKNSNNSLIVALLDKKIENDFASGRTVVVNGWILSQTEAQQCALFSLS
jgi:elongation factor P--beta-lysine ligase